MGSKWLAPVSSMDCCQSILPAPRANGWHGGSRSKGVPEAARNGGVPMEPTKITMTSESFAGLGGGRIAYIRPLKPVEARNLFPQMPQVAPDLELWALVGADGTPIMLADSREAVILNAHENDLETLSIH